jgi:hypothetical protein
MTIRHITPLIGMRLRVTVRRPRDIFSRRLAAAPGLQSGAVLTITAIHERVVDVLLDGDECPYTLERVLLTTANFAEASEAIPVELGTKLEVMSGRTIPTGKNRKLHWGTVVEVTNLQAGYFDGRVIGSDTPVRIWLGYCSTMYFRVLTNA